MKLFRNLLILFLPFFSIEFCFSQDAIIFQTEGSSFMPVISLKDKAYVRWTFADGDTSNLLHPEKNFGSDATRLNSLYVNPWSAVKMINIGYDAGDGGGYNIPFEADQQVSKIKNLHLVKDYLQIWCSSYNLLDTLVFDDFILLDTVECFLSRTVKHVSLKNTPGIKRLCLEDNDLTTLDISGCTGLTDLRGAVNNYSTIHFSNSTEEIWHICVRDNPQLTNDTLFTHIDKFPNLTELFIWNTNQKGVFKAHQCFESSSIMIMADGDHFTALDLQGGIMKGDGTSWITFNYNNLKSVNIEGFTEISRLELNYNGMAADTVDKILYQADQLNIEGSSDKRIELLGNEMPTPAGIAYKKNLENKNWNILVEGPHIAVSGNKIQIENGDQTPSEADNTAFDSTAIADRLVKSFVITNSGSYDLHLTSDPAVEISGLHASDFKVSKMPSTAIKSWNGESTFEIAFHPSAPGLHEAVVKIENDGVDNKNNYTFGIQGTGIASDQILDERLKDNIEVFPNPGKGIFHIVVPERFKRSEITVVNALGIVVFKNYPVNGVIDLTSLDKGMYFLSLKNGQEYICKKICIEFH
jgi:hypothetical protein